LHLSCLAYNDTLKKPSVKIGNIGKTLLLLIGRKVEKSLAKMGKIGQVGKNCSPFKMIEWATGAWLIPFCLAVVVPTTIQGFLLPMFVLSLLVDSFGTFSS